MRQGETDSWKNLKSKISCQTPINPVTEFIDPGLGNKVNFCIGFSYRPASHVAWRAGTTIPCRSWLYPPVMDIWIRLLHGTKDAFTVRYCIYLRYSELKMLKIKWTPWRGNISHRCVKLSRAGILKDYNGPSCVKSFHMWNDRGKIVLMKSKYIWSK